MAKEILGDSDMWTLSRMYGFNGTAARRLILTALGKEPNGSNAISQAYSKQFMPQKIADGAAKRQRRGNDAGDGYSNGVGAGHAVKRMKFE